MTFKAIILNDITKRINAERKQRGIGLNLRDTQMFRDQTEEEQEKETKKDPLVR